MPAIFFVLPLSMLSSSASSSALRSMRSARRQISASRSAGSIVAHGPRSNASRAAATALSTSARLASGTDATSAPVAGSSTGMRTFDSDATHCPPINSFTGRRRNAATPADGAGWVAIARLISLPMYSSSTSLSKASVEPASTAPQGKMSRRRAAAAEVSSSSELQEVDRVALENQGTHVVADVDLREIREPALRRDQRIVRAEQHFALQLRVRVL